MQVDREMFSDHYDSLTMNNIYIFHSPWQSTKAQWCPSMTLFSPIKKQIGQIHYVGKKMITVDEDGKGALARVKYGV